MAGKGGRGFARMDPEKQREIARAGGRAAHASGHAHEWDSKQAAVAGRKGGLAAHHHKSAAFHHDTAAHHHRQAAVHYEGGDEHEAGMHADEAHDHGTTAREHLEEARFHGSKGRENISPADEATADTEQQDEQTYGDGGRARAEAAVENYPESEGLTSGNGRAAHGDLDEDGVPVRARNARFPGTN